MRCVVTAREIPPGQTIKIWGKYKAHHPTKPQTETIPIHGTAWDNPLTWAILTTLRNATKTKELLYTKYPPHNHQTTTTPRPPRPTRTTHPLQNPTTPRLIHRPHPLDHTIPTTPRTRNPLHHPPKHHLPKPLPRPHPPPHTTQPPPQNHTQHDQHTQQNHINKAHTNQHTTNTPDKTTSTKHTPTNTHPTKPHQQHTHQPKHTR